MESHTARTQLDYFVSVTLFWLLFVLVPLALSLRSQSCKAGQPQWQELQTAAGVCPWLISLLPREWCHQQWVCLPTSVLLIKTIIPHGRLRRTVSWLILDRIQLTDKFNHHHAVCKIVLFIAEWSSTIHTCDTLFLSVFLNRYGLDYNPNATNLMADHNIHIL